MSWTLATPLAIAADAPLGERLPLWSLAPFVLILLSIAILPLVAERWWESNRNKGLVAALFALPFAIWLYDAFGAESIGHLEHAGGDYVSFLTLLGALYVVSGGIYVKGSLAGSPLSNTALLAISAVLANVIGTTGASMVLIRPLLRANRSRARKVHIVVFFIFIASNCGGLLTPFADPPLFLGFLKGVPFEWTLRFWGEWLTVNGILLVVFHFVDSYMLDKDELEKVGDLLDKVLQHEPLGIEGRHNLLLLLAIVGVILAKGQGLGTADGHWPLGMQEAAMAAIAAASYVSTRKATHARNEFTFGPILEVAILFAGIFITMIAPLAILNARGAQLGIEQPWHYFWATGGLSAFLDNAPTYMTFTAVACGQVGVSVDGPRYLAEYIAARPVDSLILEAISCGAVMMGAMTYIGNGPNFMVKAIAEHNGVKMPSFFGYMAWSCAILLPVFVIVTLLFYR
jgi:Na+/H+ antiporter NhaD/arsenite permease-like protein